MQSIDGRIVYSATDLVGFVECGHLAQLDRAAVAGHLQRPIRTDPVLERIAQRGIEHERRFLRELASEGHAVLDLTSQDDPALTRGTQLERDARLTIEAMQHGIDVIYQATFFDGHRLGRVDFLRRVETPSNLGTWSYEVWDTKLARHAKASAVLQLCFYSDLLASLQRTAPHSMYLALGGVAEETVTFRVADYAAYYRLVARDFEAALAVGDVFPVSSYPEPVEHCDVCAWTVECKTRWRADDHLSLVAGITSRQRRALVAADILTRTALAGLSDPPLDPVPDIKRPSLNRIRQQAAIQVRGDGAPALLHELIELPRTREDTFVPNYGLSLLPPPSSGDLFFDIEGDPFFGTREIDGIEYLFGVIEPGRLDAGSRATFHDFWAIEDGKVTQALEKRAFEAFIDLVMDRLHADPDMHVYHYASYEPTAMGRLANRHSTRQDEVDALLRGHVFVDLYRVVMQGLRASVESYSIKRLEPLYGFTRDIEMRTADKSIIEFESWLELGGDPTRANEIIDEIRRYNRDDCLSTWRLRDWLETQRNALATQIGVEVPRPQFAEEPPRPLTDQQVLTREMVAALTSGLPTEPAEIAAADYGRWLLAQLLEWHRREDKSFWWNYFRLRELSDEERREDNEALGELTALGPVGTTRQSTIYRFRFPQQDHKIAVGDTPRDPEGHGVGTVHFIDDQAGIIELSRGNRMAPPEPTSLIPYNYIAATYQPAALRRIAEWVIVRGMEADGEHRAGRDLLLRHPPRLGQPAGASLVGQDEDVQLAARRLVMALSGTYLAIQGPPGSGKSTVGAQMIVDLVQAGKKVGVTATSHKVISELLKKVGGAAAARGVALTIAHRNDDPPYEGSISVGNEEARAGLADGTLHVVGGTAWLWSREEMARAVDVLFVDEAGQMSLADALAASTGADRLVLLGDPQQLDQVTQGSHPPGAGQSALAHLLDGAETMPPTLGLFLDGTYRLHPSITKFTSEVFYDDRLRSHAGRDRHDLLGVSPLAGTGLRFIESVHTGHSSDSPEEAAQIADAVHALMGAQPAWVDHEGAMHPVALDDVLIITPYNAQVHAIEVALHGARVGTVDKFQGQEAPISIYSMATSSAEEAPRGMEFLYSLNRLNVATSRAQCLAVVVASPGLLLARCRTPRQMRLVNALARLIELATE